MSDGCGHTVPSQSAAKTLQHVLSFRGYGAEAVVHLSRRGRGHSGTEGGPHLRYVFRGRRGLFLRPPHVRDFVKEGYFFVPRYEVWRSKSPYNPRNIRGSDAE